MKIKDIRRLDADQRRARLAQYRREYMDIKAQLASGGSIDDPGRISEIKKTIAQLHTLAREDELGINQ